jgi:hypothetical protein
MGGYGMGTRVQCMPGGLECCHIDLVANQLGGSISVRRVSGWTAVFIFDAPTAGPEA